MTRKWKTVSEMLRRLSNNLNADGNNITNVGRLGTDELVGGITGDTTLDELAGAGLEIDEQSLRVLAAIWDGSNVVADVNNESVTTERASIDEFSSMFDHGITTSAYRYTLSYESLSGWDILEVGSASVSLDEGAVLQTGTEADSYVRFRKSFDSILNERSDIFTRTAVRGLNNVGSERFLFGWGDLSGGDSRGQAIGVDSNDLVYLADEEINIIESDYDFGDFSILAVKYDHDAFETSYYLNGELLETVDTSPSHSPSSRNQRPTVHRLENPNGTDVTVKVGPSDAIKEGV